MLLDHGWLKDPPQAVPDAYKTQDTVEAYREYYRRDKAHFSKWAYSKKPVWMI